MNSQSAAAAYQQSAVENAPPLQIVQLLYQGALRFLAQAKNADTSAGPQTFNALVNQAGAIVSELRCALDHDIAPELASDLDSLYSFVQTELSEATISQQHVHLDAASTVLSRLLEGWMGIQTDGAAAQA